MTWQTSRSELNKSKAYIDQPAIHVDYTQFSIWCLQYIQDVQGHMFYQLTGGQTGRYELDMTISYESLLIYTEYWM